MHSLTIRDNFSMMCEVVKGSSQTSPQPRPYVNFPITQSNEVSHYFHSCQSKKRYKTISSLATAQMTMSPFPPQRFIASTFQSKLACVCIPCCFYPFDMYWFCTFSNIWLSLSVK